MKKTTKTALIIAGAVVAVNEIVVLETMFSKLKETYPTATRKELGKAYASFLKWSWKRGASGQPVVTKDMMFAQLDESFFEMIHCNN